MPFVYNVDTAAVAAAFTTHATPDQEIDAMFVAPKATVPTRNVYLLSMMVGGKGAGLTVISGISYRIKKNTGGASSGGTAITPVKMDELQPAQRFSAGGASAGVTSGSTPVFVGGCMSGAAGPGGWVAENPDATPQVEGGTTPSMSLDLFVSSGQPSLKYEAKWKVQE